MKSLVVAATICAMASPSIAETLNEPKIKAPVIVKETKASSSSVAVWVPLLVLAIGASAVAKK